MLFLRDMILTEIKKDLKKMQCKAKFTGSVPVIDGTYFMQSKDCDIFLTALSVKDDIVGFGFQFDRDIYITFPEEATLTLVQKSYNNH